MTRYLLSAALLLCCGGSVLAAESADEVLARARRIYAEEGPRPALAEYEAALSLYRESGDRLGEAVTLGYLGNCYKRFGDFERAFELLGQALSMKRELEARLEEAKTLSHLGLVHWEAGEYDEAIRHFEEAGAIARAEGDARTEGAALNNLSLVYDELGEYERSLRQYRRVLEIYRGVDFPRGESDTLGNIGGVYLMLGRYREAMDHYRQSLEIAEREGLKPSMSQDLLNLALCHLGVGDVEEALASAGRSLELAREAGLEQEEAFALRARGTALLRLGRYDEGLTAHRQALAIYDEVGARGEQVEALAEMAALLLDLGDIATAEKQLRRAVELAREIGDAQGLTGALLELAELERRRGRFEQATALATEGLRRAEEAGELALAARSRLALAAIHVERGRGEEAEVEAIRALERAREIGASLIEARVLWILGEIALASGEAGAALERFEAGEALAAPVGDPDLLWRLRHGRGRALVAAGNRRQAVDVLKSAVEVIESVRGRLREERFRAGYLEDKHRVYVDLVRLLLELDRVEEALLSTERLRARSFLELHDRGARPSPSDAERRREIELRERIRQLERLMQEETGGSASWRREPAERYFSRELAAAEREYQAFLDDHLGGVAAWGATELLPVGELRDRLPPRTAVVEYLVADDLLVTFVLTRGKLRAASKTLAPGELAAKVELFRDLLHRTESDLWLGPSRTLAELLIRPAERSGWFDGIDLLVLVPHGLLHYVPFAALLRQFEDGERLLVEDYDLSYLPSVSAFGRPRAVGATEETMLALAPERGRLRWAREEARGIARLYRPGSRALLGGDATEETFKRIAGGYRLLHLAGHGSFNKLNPLLSGLELEPSEEDDGRLEVHEILELSLGADLVTLSACDTALGSGHFSEFPPGDDFVGLTRAFLLAGSASVIATLWKVDDRSTLELMRSFYGRLADGDGGDGVAALSRTQRQMAGAGGSSGHPYHWAPFVLVGGVR